MQGHRGRRHHRRDHRPHPGPRARSCSRSAVGRYTKDTRELIQKRQEADRVVKAWMQEFGDRPQGELTLVLIENLRAMAIDTMRHLAKREEPASSEDIARLSLALKRIESTEERRLQREQAAEKAAEAAKPKPKPRKGLSPETVALIRSKVEGIPYRPGDPIPSNPDESQLSPDKLAEMYPEIAPRLYRTSPQSILSLGPEPEIVVRARGPQQAAERRLPLRPRAIQHRRRQQGQVRARGHGHDPRSAIRPGHPRGRLVLAKTKNVDARNKSGHDDVVG